MEQIFSAAKRVGNMHHAVSEHLCKVGAKADVTVRYLIAKADYRWANTYGTPAISLSAVIDNLMQIGVLVAGLDPVPVIPDHRENIRRSSDELV